MTNLTMINQLLIIQTVVCPLITELLFYLFSFHCITYGIFGLQAKQLASQVKHLKTSEDHRVCIDIGKLTIVVAADRPVAQGFLYGLEPPPVDTVWEKIRSQSFEVSTTNEAQSLVKRNKLMLS